MRLALDVNRYADFCRGIPEAVEQLRLADEILLPLNALAELRAGFRRGAHKEENEKALAQFLQSPRTSVLLPDQATTHFYALIHADLKARGTPIPINDLWIAALVMQHDLVLFSRDAHFDHVKQIARI